VLVSRVTQLTKDDVIDDGHAAYLAVDGHRLLLLLLLLLLRRPRLAGLVRKFRDQDEPRWTLARLGAQAPWLFPGRSPERPAVDVLFDTRLQHHGISAHAGRNTARLALAAELPASVLADLTGIGIGISTAGRCSYWARRDWTAYVAQRGADIQNDHEQLPSGTAIA
jgi:hypothetical protein